MRRTPFAALLLSASLASAQQAKHTPPPAEIPHNTSLPVTHVSLYKNGVGFFEHTGHITGNAAVTIDFTSGQLNDVLQSLTAIDLNGGRISGAGYNSTTPLDQQLKNLPLPLGETPTSLDFYNAIRGSRVEVTGNGPAITGRLLSIEERTVPTRANDENQPTKMFLTVVSELGETRTVELTASTSVHLLDTALHTDVTRYLQLLDANRSQGLRHLTLQDNGTGTRELRLSYISEVPVWKSTYRILFTDPKFSTESQSATLQGWSVVDNTTGADWINVQLSLIAGAPQSFIQPLSQPIYSRRPEVPIAQEAQLTPQTFDSSIEADDKVQIDEALHAPTRMPAPAMAMKARGIMAGSGSGIGAGSGGNVGGSVYRVGAMPADPAISYEDAVSNSTLTSTKAAGFDDYFAYNLTEPVTIRKNESALVPILQTKVTADRVTLVNYNGSFLSQPLRALWVTNTSNLTLDRGSFSIVENGNFGGEGLLDPIHPNEKRLLSYAADQAVHVTTESNKTTQRTGSITAAKGVLKVHHDEVHEITYVIHNAATEPRTVVLEEPVVNGFVLDSEKNLNADPKPTETTPTVYRFRVTVAPGATERLHSGATRKGITTYALANTNDNQIAFILHESNDNPILTAALQPILDARRKVADAQTAVDQTNKRITDLRSDEDRQRANITALANADKGSRDRFVRDLNTTEDNITETQKELITRSAALDAAKADLSTRIEAFQIDTR
jgi:hypothetical protein